jgi:hypothetical protein
MASTPPSKDINWQSGLKGRPNNLFIWILQTETNIDVNGSWKQAGVAILIPDKVDFKNILVRRDREGHFIPIKGAIHQKTIIIVNLYMPNIGTPNFL